MESHLGDRRGVGKGRVLDGWWRRVVRVREDEEGEVVRKSCQRAQHPVPQGIAMRPAEAVHAAT